MVKVPSKLQRLHAFDQTTERQRLQDARLKAEHPELLEHLERGWKREDLNDRGISR
jgi:hypothetical protein